MRAERILASWLRTRRAMRFSPKQLARRRARLWQRLQPHLARTPALAPYAGQPLSAFPATDPATLRADYGAWNSLGLSDAELRRLADKAEAGSETGDLSAGWSTGSGGGARGLFLANSKERADYIGQSLARLLPTGTLLSRQRFALHLRASNALYSDVQRGRFAFAHFPLEGSCDETMAALARFDPTILVAPPHRLLAFARTGLELPSLRHLFCGSEPVSAAETDYLEQAFGIRPRAIYQATEGFLGAECPEGRLHLNEHAIEFEFEPVPGTTGFRPIITDLRRTSQPIVRLRGDDYIELTGEICPCGYGGRVINPPQGRMGDIWRFAERTLAPPQVVAAIEDKLGAQHAWKAQADARGVVLRIAADCPEASAREAAKALEKLAGQRVTLEQDLGPWRGPKRRKVVWRDG